MSRNLRVFSLLLREIIILYGLLREDTTVLYVMNLYNSTLFFLYMKILHCDASKFARESYFVNICTRRNLVCFVYYVIKSHFTFVRRRRFNHQWHSMTSGMTSNNQYINEMFSITGKCILKFFCEYILNLIFLIIRESMNDELNI